MGRRGQTVSALILRYAAERERHGRMDRRTARNVRYNLADFAEHAPEDPKAVKRRHVEKWLQRRSDLAASTRRLRLSQLRGFCKWCVINKHMSSDPTLGVESPVVAEGIPKRLRPEEARAVAAAAASDLRVAVVVSLMLQEGLRRMEISRLAIEDVDFADRSFVVRGKGGHGKHNAALPFTGETWHLLNRYLIAEKLTNGPLIQNKFRPGCGVSPETISDLATTALVGAGVKQPGDRTKTPHSCRHTAAHDMLTKTENVRAVQQALRHKSVASTEIYLRGHVSNLRDVMDGRSYRNIDSTSDDQLRLPL